MSYCSGSHALICGMSVSPRYRGHLSPRYKPARSQVDKIRGKLRKTSSEVFRNWDQLIKHEYHFKDFIGYVELTCCNGFWIWRSRWRHQGYARQPQSRSTLLRIQMPIFSGIMMNGQLSGICLPDHQGRYSLRRCETPLSQGELKEKAELIIRNLTTTSENFERMWQILKDY